MRTRTVLTTLSVIAAIALTGCGSSGFVRFGRRRPAQQGRADLALITLDDLGPGFELDKSDDDDDDDTDLGCLNGLDKLDKSKTKPARDADICLRGRLRPVASRRVQHRRHLPHRGQGRPGAHRAGRRGRRLPSVDVTDEDGLRLQLDRSPRTPTRSTPTRPVRSTSKPPAPPRARLEFPFGLRFSAIQIGNHVTVLGYVNSVTTLGAEADALLQRCLATGWPRWPTAEAELEPLPKVVQQASWPATARHRLPRSVFKIRTAWQSCSRGLSAVEPGGPRRARPPGAAHRRPSAVPPAAPLGEASLG